VRINQWRVCVGSVVLAALTLLGAAAFAATVPTGFVDSVFVELPSDATAMKFSPDGRLFICQQSGKLRVVQNGTLLATPFLTLTVDASGERGLLGVAFDPNFETNDFVYVYYTATSPTIHNRVSRFTANGNVAVPGSEVVLLNLNTLSEAPDHNGGAIHFGNDGKLYIAVGDNANGANSQSLGNLFGKMLRINRDGTIPADNPFFNTAAGVNRSIWALGLRNPFTTAIQRSTGRLFINDVGESTWEEINEGAPGANFGWPLAEGPSNDPDHTDPFHYYGRSDGGCAITGGAFYESAVLTFPTAYRGDYYYADYCAGWIRRIDPVTSSDVGFASGISAPVDLKVGPDGALYYLARADGRVGRISYSAAEPPSITLQPADRTVPVGQSATFTVGASGSAPLAYQWRRNGNAIAGANGSSHTVSNPQLSDSGALFDVVVSNSFGSTTSDTARLTVTQNSVPAAAITQPVSGTTYAGGITINYAGTGNDAEDGTLPASAFTWWVDLHHDAHTHPHLLPVSGSKTGSFTIPTSGETSSNVFYRIHLRVTDSGGFTRSVIRDIQPRKSTITLATSPTGLQLRLDGQPVTAPHSFVGVEGIVRSIEAVSPQGTNWVFSSWSDGGPRVHSISTPTADTTYTAQYAAQSAVSIAIANVSILEGNAGTKTVVFPVTLSSARATPVSVGWKTTNGSAKSGSDYTAGSGTVTFPAGTTLRTIAVTINGDTAVEAKEVFYIDLSAPSGATIADARAVGSIKNDDGAGTIVFSAWNYQRTENGGYATITVTRSGGLGGGMTVGYSTANGTASAGTDYTATNGTLTFGAGVESASFQVPITNDTRDEVNETVNLSLGNPAGGAVLGTRRTAVLTIVDNDSGGVLNFSVGAYERGESGGSATIKVIRSSGAASGVTVHYTTSAGTASATADYTPTSGTLRFAAGQTAARFAVAIRNDTLNEANETVNLLLADPTGGASLGSRPTAVLTILDDE
jgi:glucose/arabinose dehydrogenase